MKNLVLERVLRRLEEERRGKILPCSGEIVLIVILAYLKLYEYGKILVTKSDIDFARIIITSS